MQTLFITTFDYLPRLGGVANCTHELAIALQKHFNVILIAPHEIDDHLFDEEQSLKIIRLKLPKSSLKAIPQFTKSLLHLTKTHQPSAVLCTTWNPCAISALAINKIKGTPYFVLTHGVEVLESSSNLKKRLRSCLSFIKKIVYKAALHNFAVSDYTKNLIIQNCSVDPHNVTIAYNGVDQNNFKTLEKDFSVLGNKDFSHTKIVLTVCRLVPHKGVDQSLKAFSIIQKDFPNSLYLIVGDGPERERLKQLSKDLGVTNQVIFTGPASKKEIISFYNICDVFIMMSKEDLNTPAVEGFGLTFLEAGACGKPVIAGNSGGTPSAVKDEVTGFLVSPTDPAEAAKRLSQLLSNHELCLQFGKNALDLIENELNWENAASKISSKIKEYSVNEDV